MDKKSKESRDFTKDSLAKVVESKKGKVEFYCYRTKVHRNLSFERQVQLECPKLPLVGWHPLHAEHCSCIISFKVLIKLSIYLVESQRQETKVHSNWLVTRKKKEGITGSQTENSRDNFRRGWTQVLHRHHREAICPFSLLVFSLLVLCVNRLFPVMTKMTLSASEVCFTSLLTHWIYVDPIRPLEVPMFVLLGSPVHP